MGKTLTQTLREAWPMQKDNAMLAYALFNSWCDVKMSRVSGIGTVERLAVRLHLGRSIEEAATQEYLYRWHLAVKAPGQCNATGRRNYDPRDRNPYACISIFGTPHTIGM